MIAQIDIINELKEKLKIYKDFEEYKNSDYIKNIIIPKIEKEETEINELLKNSFKHYNININKIIRNVINDHLDSWNSKVFNKKIKNEDYKKLRNNLSFLEEIYKKIFEGKYVKKKKNYEKYNNCINIYSYNDNGLDKNYITDIEFTLFKSNITENVFISKFMISPITKYGINNVCLGKDKKLANVICDEIPNNFNGITEVERLLNRNFNTKDLDYLLSDYDADEDIDFSSYIYNGIDIDTNKDFHSIMDEVFDNDLIIPIKYINLIKEKKDYEIKLEKKDIEKVNTIMDKINEEEDYNKKIFLQLKLIRFENNKFKQLYLENQFSKYSELIKILVDNNIMLTSILKKINPEIKKSKIYRTIKDIIQNKKKFLEFLPASMYPSMSICGEYSENLELSPEEIRKALEGFDEQAEYVIDQKRIYSELGIDDDYEDENFDDIEKFLRKTIPDNLEKYKEENKITNDSLVKLKKATENINTFSNNNRDDEITKIKKELNKIDETEKRIESDIDKIKSDINNINNIFKELVKKMENN